MIDGHKIWTSYSDVADWCFLLARTDPDVPKHKGLSAFAVPMHQPGIEQRPLRMINGITTEFGQVLFDGARVPAENMIGEPGEGWRVAMTIVSHEREPGELGYVARYAKTVKELERTVRADPAAFRADQREAVAWAYVQAEMLRLHVCRRLSERLDGIDHGPGGSIDKLLMTWVEQTVGAAALAVSGPQRGARRRRRRAQDLPLQPRAERHGRHVPDPEEHRRHAHPRPADGLSSAPKGTPMYDLPDVIRVEADGPVRIVRLARPEQLNAINDELHLGLTRLFPQLSADADARVAVITGEGRAFSAGGDFDLLDRMANDRALRRDVIAEGRELVLNMIRCRVPVVAAVNGPAVGLGCSVIALSDVVYMAESAYLSDPHVTVGLVAADGGPLDLAAAHEPAARQGVRVHRRPDHRGARGARSASPTTCAPTARCSPPRSRPRTRSPRCRGRRSRRRSGCSTCTSSEPCSRRSTSRWRPRPRRSTRPSCARTSTASSGR